MRAIVTGGTGLVGRELLALLEQSPQFTEVVSLQRSKISAEISSESKFKKVVQQTFHFSDWNTISNLSKFDVAFCSLGTTIKKAGSKAQFKQIDHDMVLAFATWAKENGVQHFILVSALGANSNSKIFYNQVKGETERDMRKLQFEKLSILRPSLLLGERDEPRFFEQLGDRLLEGRDWLFPGVLKTYQPIHAKKLASKMLDLTKDQPEQFRVVENAEIHR